MSERSKGSEELRVAERDASRERERYETAAVSAASERHPERNEDAYAVGDRWAVVCDGVSKPRGGEVAARAATARLAETFSSFARDFPNSTIDEVEEMMRNAIGAADTAAVEETERAGVKGASTTVAALYLFEGSPGERRAVVAWLGNSRAYHVAASGEISQETRDHGSLQATVEYRNASETERRAMDEALDEAEFAEDMEDPFLRQGFLDRSILTRILGRLDQDARPDPDAPDMTTLSLADGDELWLFSDGVTDNLTGERLRALLGAPGGLEERAQGIVAAAQEYARQRGYIDRAHFDDMTAVALKAPARAKRGS